MVNSKGGTGKTTTAVYLASAAFRQHPEWGIGLLDTDPQRSATDWAVSAMDAGDRLPFSVVHTDNVLDVRYDADLLIVDTAPGDGETIRKALNMADVVVVPSEAETMSLTRAKATLDRSGGKGRILLTKVNRRTRLYADACEVIKEMDIPRFETEIPYSVRFQTYGMAPLSLSSYTDLWLEIQRMIGE